MWMMDSLRSRKLRPLFNRLPSQTSAANSRVTAAFPFCCLAHRVQCMDAGFRGHHWTARKGMDQQARREGSRWNPTKEQLRALEELYAQGTRTPQAHQIQLIAAQLRRYGRIEGKNVFYWFQNHKARERQRLRRQAEEAATATASDHKQDSDGAAAARAGVLKQESKSWAPAKPCSCTSPATSADAGGRGEETAYSPWLLLQHRQKQGWAEGDAPWQQTSGHQRPLPCLPRAAATSSTSSSGGGGGGGDHSNLEISWACRTLSREFAEPTTLELFPLSSENNLVGSSLPSKPNTSPHVQFFHFL